MPIISVGMVLLAMAAVVAQTGIGLEHFYLSLILLGVGWNFGFIGGTHLLQQSITVNERGAIQGFNDTVLAIVGSAASIVAGAVYISIGWNSVSYFVLALLALSATVVLWMLRRYSDKSPA